MEENKINIKTVNIGNALTSIAPDHIVATTNDIYDEELQQYQSDFNQATNTSISNLTTEVSKAVTLDSEQSITAKKIFNNSISISGKTTIANIIDPGELKVLHNNSSKGFILKTANSSDHKLPVQILSTNGTYSNTYNFPKLENINNNQFCNLATKITFNGETYSAAQDGCIDLGELIIPEVVEEDIINIYHRDLVSLRDRDSLIPGKKYRIIDYNTTVAEFTDISAANHPFDIVIEALSKNSLSENAKAVRTIRDVHNKITEVFSFGHPSAEWNNGTNVAITQTEKDLLLPFISGPTEFRYNQSTRNINTVGTLKVIFTPQTTSTDPENVDICLGAALIDSNTNKIISYDFHEGILSNNGQIIATNNEYFLPVESTGRYIIRYYIGNLEPATELNILAELYSTSYFVNSKLDVWEIKYCLDNDTNRFSWADSENGKGVIYYMKDEWGNGAPYDFKNIQFRRNHDILSTYYTGINNQYGDSSSIASNILESMKDSLVVSNIADEYFYTFSKIEDDNNNLNITDHSISGNSFDNKIGNYINGSILTLNNTVFIIKNSGPIYNNKISEGCLNNTICGGTGNIVNNTIDLNFKYNNFVGSFNNNSIGKSCQNNAFTAGGGEPVISWNKVGDSFKKIIFTNGTFSYNNIGVKFTEANIGNTFMYNNLGNNIWRFKCGYKTSYCNIGSYFQYNSLLALESYPSEYTEMKYCNFGDGIEGADYIPPMQNVTFENQCWFGNSQVVFHDLKLIDESSLINKLIKSHNQHLYVFRSTGSDNSSSPKYLVRSSSDLNLGKIDLGEFTSSSQVDNKTSGVAKNFLTRTDISYLTYLINNDEEDYSYRGNIRQVFEFLENNHIATVQFLDLKDSCYCRRYVVGANNLSNWSTVHTKRMRDITCFYENDSIDVAQITPKYNNDGRGTYRKDNGNVDVFFTLTSATSDKVGLMSKDSFNKLTELNNFLTKLKTAFGTEDIDTIISKLSSLK